MSARPCWPLLVALLATSSAAVAADGAAAIAELAALTAPPATYVAAGVAEQEGVTALFFEGVPWEGRPTRVFARLGLPAGVKGRLPGIVLVHGGGGTAFAEWVRKWNAHGLAAIAIAVEGQTDERNPGGERGNQWKRHAWAGPARVGIYGDSAQPLREQWMYHAVAATIRAHSLLLGRPEIDPTKVGVAGISWGGVITSTVIGIDRRFAFAIATYGCGDLATAGNQYGRALADNAVYRDTWNPLRRLGTATLPVLWYSWPGDEHFPLDAQARCYRAAPGPRMVVLRPGMKHSHPAGWNPPDSYAFAESVVRAGRPWLRQTALTTGNGHAQIAFTSDKPLDRAVLIWTSDTGFTGKRGWTESPAELRPSGDGGWTAVANVPPNATGWFINVHAGELLGSSDYQDTALPP